jgi:hypothetical protein
LLDRRSRGAVGRDGLYGRADPALTFRCSAAKFKMTALGGKIDTYV